MLFSESVILRNVWNSQEHPLSVEAQGPELICFVFIGMNDISMLLIYSLFDTCTSPFLLPLGSLALCQIAF